LHRSRSRIKIRGHIFEANHSQQAPDNLIELAGAIIKSLKARRLESDKD